VTILSEKVPIGSGSPSRFRVLWATSTVIDIVSGYLVGSSILRSAVPEHDRATGAAFVTLAVKAIVVAMMVRISPLPRSRDASTLPASIGAAKCGSRVEVDLSSQNLRVGSTPNQEGNFWPLGCLAVDFFLNAFSVDTRHEQAKLGLLTTTITIGCANVRTDCTNSGYDLVVVDRKITDYERRYRAAITLSRYQALRLVKAQHRSAGRKLHMIKMSELRTEADRYFDEHRSELLDWAAPRVAKLLSAEPRKRG